MKEAHILSADDAREIQPLQLDDFSRFKEKVIMIKALEGLVSDTDKALLKTIVRDAGAKMTTKNLKNALQSIVDQAIKRAAI